MDRSSFLKSATAAGARSAMGLPAEGQLRWLGNIASRLQT